MRATALVLILLGASPQQRFEGYVGRAAHEGGLARPAVRLGDSTELRAWVYPPIRVIWIDRTYLFTAEPAELCRTAYHEVCHLWLQKRHEYDDDDHRQVDRCMRELGAGRCVMLNRYYP